MPYKNKDQLDFFEPPSEPSLLEKAMNSSNAPEGQSSQPVNLEKDQKAQREFFIDRSEPVIVTKNSKTNGLCVIAIKNGFDDRRPVMVSIYNSEENNGVQVNNARKYPEELHQQLIAEALRAFQQVGEQYYGRAVRVTKKRSVEEIDPTIDKLRNKIEEWRHRDPQGDPRLSS